MTVNDMIHKALGAGFAALTVGAGAMVINVNRNDAVQDTKLVAIQASMEKLDQINKSIAEINTKVDVVNQKLDDAKEQLSKHK